MIRTIIVASMGRCGSTLLFKALGGAWEKSIREIFICDLAADILPGRILKSHDFAPAALPPHVKVVYLFGDPYGIVLSNWDKMKRKDIVQHFIHLHGYYDRKERMLEEDVLRLKENFRSWHRPHPYPVLTVRYETMWQNVDALRSFTGLPVDLPPCQPRRDYRDDLTEFMP